jgi:hypothetical protein
MGARQGRRPPAPVRITTAGTSRGDEIAARQRRYVVSMGIRTCCFIAAVLVGDNWLRWVLIVCSAFLPYVAVVMANAVKSRDDGFALLDGKGARGQLSASTNADDTR